MKKKTSTLRWRIGILAVLILMLATVLTGCGSSGSGSKPTYTRALEKAADGGLDAEQLNAVADLLVNTYAKDFNTNYMLLAASNGYDMTAEDFDDNNLQETDRVDAAKNLLKKAQEKAVASKSLEQYQVSDACIENINGADLDKLVTMFQTSVDLSASSGVFDSIQRGIGYFLNWLTTYLGFGSYIVGICVFAVLVEALMTPFAIKQQKNSIKQAKLRPKEMAIRKKYAGRNDQVTMQKVQKEIQEMYAKENFSPYSGCLPLLVQFPIIIILYNIIINPLVYVLGQSAGVSSAMSLFYAAPKAAGGLGHAAVSAKSTIELLSGGIGQYEGIANFGLFSNGDKVWDSIQSIKALPNFNIGPFDFGLAPSFRRFDILLLVPVLTFVVYFFSMKLTRKFSGQAPAAGATDRQTACSNAMMDIMMPAMSAIFTFMVPGIVGVYWMFRSVIGILKSFIMSKVMPLPTFTEADYKAAEKELAGKAPKKVQKSEKAGTVRSLHHIDDEDFEDTREAALERKARMEEQTKKEQAEKAESAKKSPFGIPLLKKDRKAEKQEAEKDAKTDEKPAEAPAEVPAENTPAENAPTEAPAENALTEVPAENAPTETKPEETTNSEDGQAK